MAAAVRAHFGAGRIDPAAYRDRITEDLSSDPDDRAHLAACLDGRVDVLLTRDAKDFPADLLADAGVSVMPADRYLLRFLQRRPKAVTEFFVATAEARTRPPVTPCELADRIDTAGAHGFAARVRRRLGCVSVNPLQGRRHSVARRAGTPKRPPGSAPRPRFSLLRPWPVPAAGRG